MVVARDKAKDMVNKNYVDHISPTYGSPFDMLESYGITYKAAGENLARNSSNVRVVEAWMNSEDHKANILNNSFNYTGIGVNDSKHGKILCSIIYKKITIQIN